MQASLVLLFFFAAFLSLNCGGPDRRYQAGAADIDRYGCGSCHTIPGIRGANGKVGPSLAGVGNRRYIAGELSNSPDNMTHWIQHPRAVNEKTVMPELGVTSQDAQDISALLYSLK